MSILKFTDEDEVIRRANDTDYGLAAGVFSQDISRAHRVINQMQTGIGRENGPETPHNYTQIKSVFVRLDDLVSPY